MNDGGDERRRVAACCRALLDVAGMASLWTAEGPTEDAQAILDGAPRGRFFSGQEQLLVRVCFDLWNGRGGAHVGRLLDTLDGEKLEAVGELLVAIAHGRDAVEAWSERHRSPQRLDY